MEQQLEQVTGDRSLLHETVDDNWFRGAVALGVIAVSEVVNIPFESSTEPRAAIISGVFCVAAVTVGRKALANFRERLDSRNRIEA